MRRNVIAAPAVATSELPTVHEHVRIESFVAEGGFGRVYRGHHLTLDRPVAIKVLKVPEEYSEGMRAIFFERFAQEARIIASLDHPAVVRALDFGVAHDAEGREAPYMILDWIDGRTLHRAISERCEAGRPFDRDEVLLLLAPVMEALAQAHARGITHRDITPGNLMLVDGPTGASLRLLDFGIAKVVDDTRPEPSPTRDESHTHTALLAFSPRWASPEQAARGRTGPWTDVHALGLVCVAMLTGERPYRGTNEGLFQEIFSERRPTPAALGFDVGTWEAVLSRALALRPEQRPPDAGTLLRELQDAMAPAALTRVYTVPESLRAPRPVPPAVEARSPWFYVALGVTLTLLAWTLSFTFATRRPGALAAPAPRPVTVAPRVEARPAAMPAAPAIQPIAVAPSVPTSARAQASPGHRRRVTEPRSVAVDLTPAPTPIPTPAEAPRAEAPDRARGPRIAPIEEYR